MPVRVLVHGAVWVEDKLVVHRRDGDGAAAEMSLPGGRIHDHESLTVALARLVREQIDCAVDVGELVWAGRDGTADEQREADVLLVFAARLCAADEAPRLELVDPRGPTAAQVRPAVLDYLAAHRDEASDPTQPARDVAAADDRAAV
jgi:ADP-ribose pyrophosphatase YjhB (NUDIX family)